MQVVIMCNGFSMILCIELFANNINKILWVCRSEKLIILAYPSVWQFAGLRRARKITRDTMRTKDERCCFFRAWESALQSFLCCSWGGRSRIRPTKKCKGSRRWPPTSGFRLRAFCLILCGKRSLRSLLSPFASGHRKSNKIRIGFANCTFKF